MGKCRDTTSEAGHRERGRKCRWRVIKITSIIALDAPDGAAKLHGHKGKEVGESGEGVKLLAQWKSPWVVGVVIEDDQVILVTRDTQNRGGRKVIMYEVKGL
jgi:hypothetical protein